MSFDMQGYLQQQGHRYGYTRNSQVTQHPVRSTRAARPAGQVVVPSTVQTNGLGQLVDATGRVITDQYGNPIQYSPPNRTMHFIVNLLVAAAVVGIPAYAASYYGARRAAGK